MFYQLEHMGFFEHFQKDYSLTNTDNTVLQCSADCGYNNLRSFNRNFKLVTGMTPQEYRESN